MKKLTPEQIEMLELWMNNPDAREWQFKSPQGVSWCDSSTSYLQIPTAIIENSVKYRIKPKTKTVYFALIKDDKNNIESVSSECKDTIDSYGCFLVSPIYECEVPV